VYTRRCQGGQETLAETELQIAELALHESGGRTGWCWCQLAYLKSRPQEAKTISAIDSARGEAAWRHQAEPTVASVRDRRGRRIGGGKFWSDFWSEGICRSTGRQNRELTISPEKLSLWNNETIYAKTQFQEFSNQQKQRDRRKCLLRQRFPVEQHTSGEHRLLRLNVADIDHHNCKAACTHRITSTDNYLEQAAVFGVDDGRARQTVTERKTSYPKCTFMMCIVSFRVTHPLSPNKEPFLSILTSFSLLPTSPSLTFL